MDSTPPLVRMEQVCKTYAMGRQTVHALDGVSVDFAAGSFWAIMGPSGSGKSTLMNLLGFLDRPSAGRHWFEGRDVSALNDDQRSELRLRRLGFIFQSFNLIPQLTVRENIALPLYYLGWDDDACANRAAELAALVGLDARLDHKPMELSGGQQQRVAIARALSNDPALLLADEPTGNLDSATSLQIMNLIDRLNADGKTILLVTHEPDIAARARYRLHLRDGKVERKEE